MAETALADHLADERSRAARALLAEPFLDAEARPDDFRLVARHAAWLVDYFEKTCGWSLAVDAAGGFARLAKRAVEVDTSRPLLRTRTAPAPFDRRRYELLCLVCAELVRRPMTTVGLLAAAVGPEAGLDTSRHGERAAFVDALRALLAWGVVRVTAGEVEAFVESQTSNALLYADTTRLHRLLVSATAPSSLPVGMGAGEATERLLAEPRYGPAPDDPTAERGDEARTRWARHRLGRRILDDPAVYQDDMGATERAYLQSPAGRKWLRDRVAEAGFELEERSEGLVAVDPEALATDRVFPAPHGNVHQMALLLVDRLVTTAADGRRSLGQLSPAQLQREVDSVLARFPGWARGQRDEDGRRRLARDGADLLVSFRLARREADGGLVALPALARYRAAAPRVSGAATLFEELE